MKNYRGARIFQNQGRVEGPVKAAIVVFNGDLDVIQFPDLTTNNIVVVKIRTKSWEIVVASYYFEPKPTPIEPYLEQLREIERKLGTPRMLIGGDSNAKSSWWGSPEVDDRGEEMAGALEEMGLQVLNEGDLPTFEVVRGGRLYTSNVDVTACSTEMLGVVENWRVEDAMVSSDHNAILFSLNLKKSKGMSVKRTTRLYNTKKANWIQFLGKLSQLTIDNNLNIQEINNITSKIELENTINKYIETINKTCIDTLPKKKEINKLNLPWWSEELHNLKRRVLTIKRRIRCAAPRRRDRVIAEYLEAKEEYTERAEMKAIESWKEFCGKQDGEGMWEGIYRVIRCTGKRQEDLPLEVEGKVLDQEESAKLLAETFYPEDRAEDDNEEHRRIRKLAGEVNVLDHDDHDPLFTHEELKAAVDGFNPKKAPGADGLTADICKNVIDANPDLFLSLSNRCLQLGYFPKAWKEATVIVLRKPGKQNYSVAKSYRPIGLLPVMGKVLEKLVMTRLKWHLVPNISKCQYGFMPQRSTEDALYALTKYIRSKIAEKKVVVLVSLDIEGAFDSAWWPAIRVRLAEVKCPVNIRRLLDSYLEDRGVRVRYAGHEICKTTTKGCVQGSIGGPILWNLLLDPLLKGLRERGEYCQAFADDVALVFAGDTAMEIQGRANAALEYVRGWGIRNKLKFAPHKTCAMLLTNRLKYDTPHLTMGGIDIGMSKEMKILGLVIDDKLTFNSHVAQTCRKALNVYKQLSRAARISWGLHPEIIRTIYTACVEPVVLYAASVWAPAAAKIGVQRQLNVVQRGFAQRLCKAYRTVSLNAALALTGLIPLDLRIQEAAALYEAKRGISRPATVADREIEQMSSYSSTPHPACKTEWKFHSLDTNELVNQNNLQTVRIFTDGSKIDGGVGAALSIWNETVETGTRKLKLSSYCSVYQAELLAILEATRKILKSSANSFGIYSDSRSSLETIRNHSTVHPLATEIRRNLAECSSQNKEVTLFWIKAHAGFEGNERADELAKEAATRSKTRPVYDACPVSFVKREIRKDTLDKWDRRYQSGETAATTKTFLPNIKTAYKLIKNMGPLDGTLTQILTGHGGFSEYLHRFKCKESPSCICDPEVEESILHVILECPEHLKLRHALTQTLDTPLTKENIHKMMMNNKERGIFLDYCLELAKGVIGRNKTDR